MSTRTEDTASTQAWSAADLEGDPHAAADKASRVRRMFAAIAPKYDLNNRLHSFGRDQAWRRAAVRMAELKPTDRVVDVACGTGDLTLAFYEALLWESARTERRLISLKHAQIVGIDFTLDMLPLAAKKASHDNFAGHAGPKTIAEELIHERGQRLRFVNGDAMVLPLPDACCDVVSIAFGIRNVADPRKAMREFYRVLSPGGRMIVLEFSQPGNRVIRWLNGVYCGKVMPYTATWIAGDRSGAYKYLPTSVSTFVTREGMVRMMEESGFGEIAIKPLTFGVAVVYRGVKA